MIPPYNVFVSHRMISNLLQDGAPGCVGKFFVHFLITSSSMHHTNNLASTYSSYLTDINRILPLVWLNGLKKGTSSFSSYQLILPTVSSRLMLPYIVPLQNIYSNLCHKCTESNTGCIDRYDAVDSSVKRTAKHLRQKICTQPSEEPATVLS